MEVYLELAFEAISRRKPKSLLATKGHELQKEILRCHCKYFHQWGEALDNPSRSGCFQRSIDQDFNYSKSILPCLTRRRCSPHNTKVPRLGHETLLCLTPLSCIIRFYDRHIIESSVAHSHSVLTDWQIRQECLMAVKGWHAMCY